MSEWKYQSAADLGMSPVARLKSTKREPGLISLAGHYATTLLLRTYFASYHRLSVIGRENLPRRAPFVMIANHVSHLDALVMTAALPARARLDSFPVAAGDVFFTGTATSFLSSLLLNALPLYRKGVTSHALEDLRTRLTQGQSGLILFPEGKRSRDGTMSEFKAGIGMIVAQTNVPVIPCYLEGAFGALRPGRIVPSPKKLTVRIGRALTFDSTPNEREGWRKVASECERAVRSMSEL